MYFLICMFLVIMIELHDHFINYPASSLEEAKLQQERDKNSWTYEYID